jgi:hypothetical protein
VSRVQVGGGTLSTTTLELARAVCPALSVTTTWTSYVPVAAKMWSTRGLADSTAGDPSAHRNSKLSEVPVDPRASRWAG